MTGGRPRVVSVSIPSEIDPPGGSSVRGRGMVKVLGSDCRDNSHQGYYESHGEIHSGGP
jgi:hypothetical protein